MKSHLTLYVDVHLIELAKKAQLNISREVEIYLKSRLLGSELSKDTNSEELEQIIIKEEARVLALKQELEKAKIQEKTKNKADIDKKLKDLIY